MPFLAPNENPLTQAVDETLDIVGTVVPFPESRPYSIEEYPALTREEKMNSIAEVRNVFDGGFQIVIPGAKFVASFIYLLTTRQFNVFGVARIGPLTPNQAWFFALTFAGADVANEIFEAQGIDATAYDAEDLWRFLPAPAREAAEKVKEKLPSLDRRKFICYAWDYLKSSVVAPGGMIRPGYNGGTEIVPVDNNTGLQNNKGCAGASVALISIGFALVTGIAYAAM